MPFDKARSRHHQSNRCWLIRVALAAAIATPIASSRSVRAGNWISAGGGDFSDPLNWAADPYTYRTVPDANTPAIFDNPNYPYAGSSYSGEINGGGTCQYLSVYFGNNIIFNGNLNVTGYEYHAYPADSINVEFQSSLTLQNGSINAPFGLGALCGSASLLNEDLTTNGLIDVGDPGFGTGGMLSLSKSTITGGSGSRFVGGGSGAIANITIQGSTISLQGPLQMLNGTMIISQDLLTPTQASFTGASQLGNNTTAANVNVAGGNSMLSFSAGSPTAGSLSIDRGSSFTITAGATMFSNATVFIGDFGGLADPGVLTVDGAGSSWTHDGDVDVAASGGTGRLNVINSGESAISGQLLIGSSAAVVVEGANSVLSANSVFLASGASVSIGEGATLSTKNSLAISAGGTLSLAGATAKLICASVANDGQLKLVGGEAVLGQLSGLGSITVGEPGTSKNIAHVSVSSFNQNSITICDGAVLIVANDASRSTNTATLLSVIGNGRLDLNANDLVTREPLSTVREYLLLGSSGGSWTGASGGIYSSTVAVDALHRAIAYINGANPSNSQLNTALSNGANVLIHPSLVGDTNLDGKVNGLDTRQIFTRGAFNDGLANHDWADGDMNYDGIVNGVDTRIVYTSGNFNSSTQEFASAKLTAVAADIDLEAGHTQGASPRINTAYLLYDPTSGDITFYKGAYDSKVVEVLLHSDTGQFRPGHFDDRVGSTADAYTLDVQSGSGFSIYDFGNVLPPGLAENQVLSILSPYTASNDPSGLGQSGIYLSGTNVERSYVIELVPEPVALSLLTTVGFGFLIRSRPRSLKDQLVARHGATV